MRRVRLVIADRRPIVLQGFASLFAAERDFEVVASCLDGATCLEAVRKLTPDVVLVEDGFSDVTASEMLAVANAENLPTRLVFFTASVARGDLAAAIEAGACSAVSMGARPENVMQSLRGAAPRPGQAPADKEETGAFSENGLAVLTENEREVLRLVARGLSNRVVASQLNVAPGHHQAAPRSHISEASDQQPEAARSCRPIVPIRRVWRAGSSDFRSARRRRSGREPQRRPRGDRYFHGNGRRRHRRGRNHHRQPPQRIGAVLLAPRARALIRARDVANAATGTLTPTGKLVGSGVDSYR